MTVGGAPDPPTGPITGPHRVLSRLGPYATVALVVLALRWPTLSNRILAMDEVAYLAQAALLDTPARFALAPLYRVETKSHVGLLPFLLARAFGAENAILALHILGALAVLLSCILMVRLAGRWLGSAWAGAGAAALWTVYLNVGSGWPRRIVVYGLIAPLLEYYQTPLILGSLLLLLDGLRRLSARRLPPAVFFAGVLAGIAVLVKSTALPLLAVFAGAVLFLPLERSARPRGPRLLALAALLGGAALPFLLAYGPSLTCEDAMRELWFNLVEVNRSYAALDPISGRVTALLQSVPLVLPLLVLASLGSLALWRQAAGRPSEDSAQRPPLPPAGGAGLLIVAAVALFLGAVPGRGYALYLIPAVACLSLPAAGLTVAAFRHAAGRPGYWLRTVALSGVTLHLLWCGTLVARQPAVLPRDVFLDEARGRYDVDGVVRYLRDRTGSNDRIWAYYKGTELYLLADRPPATREPSAAYLAIYWREPWFSRVAEELKRDPPRVIVDIHRPRNPLPHARPVSQIPVVGRWILEQYEVVPAGLRGVTVYRQRETASRAASGGGTASE